MLQVARNLHILRVPATEFDDGRGIALCTSSAVSAMCKPRAAVQRITLMFFFPSGVSVERQVRHGFELGGAVKQSTCGIVDDVPVPKKISSTGDC